MSLAFLLASQIVAWQARVGPLVRRLCYRGAWEVSTRGGGQRTAGGLLLLDWLMARWLRADALGGY
jgi:hypothetical protein